MLDDFKPRQPKPAEPKRIGPDGPLLVRPTINSETKETPITASAIDDIEVINEADIEKLADSPEPSEPKPPKKGRFAALNPKNWSKRKRIIAIIVAIIIVCGVGGGAYALFGHSEKPVTKPAVAKKVEPKKTVYYSPLTGKEVTADQMNLPVTGVMIENSQDARPQSGLDHAGVVFEAIAEGGITRFLALYQEDQAGYVGPVRSVRPYYLDWIQAYGGAIAHVGGSPEALSKIQADHVPDLDQFYNSGSYDRISGRVAPHNVYTSIGRLTQLEQSKGITKTDFQPWPRKSDSKAAQPNATSIDFTISSALYNPHFDYDSNANTYARSEGGKPHIELDANGQQTQIAPNVVIAMVIPNNLEGDGVHNSYGTIGSGEAIVFQDGTATKGTWAKSDRKNMITFTDASGNAIKLNAGQTWISVVSSAGSISYK